MSSLGQMNGEQNGESQKTRKYFEQSRSAVEIHQFTFVDIISLRFENVEFGFSPISKMNCNLIGYFLVLL